MTKVSYSVRYLPQSDNNRFLILQKFRSKKATNFVFYAFLLYGNFFELTRDLKKHFCKLNFDKSMIYSWHLKHPPTISIWHFFHCIQQCDEICLEKVLSFRTCSFTFSGKMFHECLVKTEGHKNKNAPSGNVSTHCVYPWKQKKHVILWLSLWLHVSGGMFTY